jgi:hypothetical protein
VPLEKGKAVYARLDFASQRLAELKSDKHELGKKFLSKWRNREELELKKQEITEAQRQTDALKRAYRVIQLVLVDVGHIVDSVSDEQLELGNGDLEAQMSRILESRANEAAVIRGSEELERKANALTPS